MIENCMFEVQKKRPTAVDIVVDKIKQLLVEQKLKPGELIPSEQVLADQLKVSRGSVREAMKILNAFGVIEIKPGSGTFISSASNKRMFDSLLFQILVQERDYKSLIEIRQIMENGIVQLVIDHATDEELNQMDAILSSFEKKLKDPDVTLAKCNEMDLAYHQAMGRCTHNQIVQNIYDFVIDLFSPTINSHQEGTEMVHRNLQKALEDRDVNRAIECISVHTKIWERNYLNAQKDKTS